MKLKNLLNKKVTKKFLVFYTLAVLLLFGSIVVMGINSALKESRAYVDDLSKSQPDIGYKSNYGIIATEGITDTDLMVADAFIECMPANVQDYVLSHDISIILVTDYLDELSQEYGNNEFIDASNDVHSVGTTQTFFNKPVIHVYNPCINSSFIHEIGHAIDFTVNGNQFFEQSHTAAFELIYKHEADTWVPFGENVEGYAASTEDEYFAESFQQYILHEDYLKDNAPMTYEYMKNFVESL